MIRPRRIKLVARAVWLPKRVISRWPATIFAISRTDRVIGRMMFLTDSIRTMNGINTPGVPDGTIWANIWVVLLIQPYTMKESQRGRANARVKVK